jgi:hypothetical protein
MPGSSKNLPAATRRHPAALGIVLVRGARARVARGARRRERASAFAALGAAQQAEAAVVFGVDRQLLAEAAARRRDELDRPAAHAGAATCNGREPTRWRYKTRDVHSVISRSTDTRRNVAEELSDMPCYELKVRLKRWTVAEPAVRAWLDPDLDAGGLASEVELPLRRVDQSEWRAAFLLAAPRTFLYRIGVAAEPGTVWVISIRQQGVRPREILFDSDVMACPKQWLLGTCSAC